MRQFCLKLFIYALDFALSESLKIYNYARSKEVASLKQKYPTISRRTLKHRSKKSFKKTCCFMLFLGTSTKTQPRSRCSTRTGLVCHSERFGSTWLAKHQLRVEELSMLKKPMGPMGHHGAPKFEGHNHHLIMPK